ncbi:TVP38/TMEM64 family protein [Pseudonocardia sp. GCM10023141]|uniref:TVP38/TMEM64 family protein n=1 Tax=Pseudonocardia sp. GCM10023141 TaxID=3252653 RepID=UPI0036129918
MQVQWGRVAAGFGAIVVVALVGVALVLSGGIDDVRRLVADAGFWAPLIFVLLHVVITIGPVPRTAFTVAAGVLFGSATGLVLAMVSTMIAAAAAFWLVRLAGGPFVERHAHRSGVAWLRARLDRSGLLAMISLRMIPAVPFSVMNYASGLSGVRFRYFLIGTLVGTLPGTVAVVVLGDAVTGGQPPLAMLLTSVAGGVIGVAGSLVAARRPVEPEPEPEPVL